MNDVYRDRLRRIQQEFYSIIFYSLIAVKGTMFLPSYLKRISAQCIAYLPVLSTVLQQVEGYLFLTEI
jgi:hypothetical protein